MKNPMGTLIRIIEFMDFTALIILREGGENSTS